MTNDLDWVERVPWGAFVAGAVRR